MLAVAFGCVLVFTVSCEEEGKCNGKKYNFEKQFCIVDSGVYDLCGGHEYEPGIETCSDGKIYPVCGSKIYDSEMQFCSGVYVYNKCEGEIYIPATQFCHENNIYDKCGKSRYEPETQFCFKNNVYYKCSGIKYKPETQFCYEFKIYDKCEGKEYKPESQYCEGNKLYKPICEIVIEDAQFCFKGAVYHKCAGAVYNPEKHGCAAPCNEDYGLLYKLDAEFFVNGSSCEVSIYKKCGGAAYNLNTQFCKGDKIQEYNCGGTNYSINTHFCYQNKLYNKCIEKEYNPDAEFCKDGQIGEKPIPAEKLAVPGDSTGAFTDSRDSSSYRWVKLGAQIWMAQNLNYNAKESQCYNNKPANCQKYGRLYNWATAVKACPAGWHLPTRLEWDALTVALGGSSTKGKYLKAGNGTDKFGFAALPGGFGNTNDYFGSAGISGYWWSASELGASMAYHRIINYSSEAADWEIENKGYLFSVRCLQD